MSLTTLHARETNIAVLFDCPCGKDHRVRVLKADNRWQITGAFPKLTIHPAIETPCGKWNVLDGEVLKS